MWVFEAKVIPLFAFKKTLNFWKSCLANKGQFGRRIEKHLSYIHIYDPVYAMDSSECFGIRLEIGRCRHLLR